MLATWLFFLFVPAIYLLRCLCLYFDRLSEICSAENMSLFFYTLIQRMVYFWIYCPLLFSIFGVRVHARRELDVCQNVINACTHTSKSTLLYFGMYIVYSHSLLLIGFFPFNIFTYTVGFFVLIKWLIV